DLAVRRPFVAAGLVLPVAEDVARLPAFTVDDVEPVRHRAPRARDERDATAVRRPREAALVARRVRDAARLAARDRDHEDVAVVAQLLVALGAERQQRDRVPLRLDDGIAA